jgi:hypothetical protein
VGLDLQAVARSHFNDFYSLRQIRHWRLLGAVGLRHGIALGVSGFSQSE